MTEQFTVGGPGVAWRETGGEIVVLDLRGSTYFGLNGTGAGLWTRLVEGADRDELTATLTAHGLSEERAATDVDDFLTELRRHGLLSGG